MVTSTARNRPMPVDLRPADGCSVVEWEFILKDSIRMTPGMTRWLLACLLAARLAAPSAASADDAAPAAGLVSELKFGALEHDVPSLWSHFRIEQAAIDPNFEVLLHPLWSTSSGMLRPALGVTVNPNGDTSKAYVDLRWQIEPSPLWYIAFGIGAAFHNGVLDNSDANRKALGSRVLFHPSLELGLNIDPYSNVSVFFDHVSNANTQRFNEGMDTLGVRYGLRF